MKTVNQNYFFFFKKIGIIPLFFVTCLVSFSAHADQINWISPVSGDWMTPSNWNLGVPGASDFAVIGASGPTGEAKLSTSTSINALAIGSLPYSGALRIEGGGNPTTTLTVTNAVQVNDGALIVNGGGTTLQATGSTAFSFVKIADLGSVTLSNNAFMKTNSVFMDGNTPTLSVTSGASLWTDRLVAFGGGTGGTVNFNNATLQPLSSGNQTLISSGFSSGQLNIGSGGLTVKTIGFDCVLDSPLSGPGALIKQGADVLILNSANTYTGGTTISAGTLQLGSGGTTGMVSGNVIDNGNLVFNRSDATLIYGNAISGSGNVRQAGSGTLVFTGANTYTGSTTIASGALSIGNGGTTGSVTGSIVNNSVLIFNRSNDITYAGLLSGTGTMTKQGAGTLFLTANSTFYTGTTTISAGTLQLGDGVDAGMVAGLIVDNATLAFKEPSASIYANVISGSGSVKQQGPGTVTFTNANIYTGNTLISGGTLQLGDGVSVGTVTSDIVNNAALVFNEPEPSDVIYGNVLSGAGTMTKQGAGTLFLTANSTFYTGTTTISAGTLQLGSGGTTGMLSGNVIDNGNLVFNRSDATLIYGNAISGSGNVRQAGSGTLIFTGANTYTGSTTIASGALSIGNGGTTGSVTGPIVNNSALIFNRSNDIMYAGLLSGTGTMTKQGAGTLILTANSTSYTGTTTISAGTLQLGDGVDAGMVAGLIVDNATLAFKEPSASIYANVISGSGSVKQQGPGTVTFTNTNTYTGNTLISGGTLQLGDGVSVGTVASDIVDNAALVFNEPSDVIYGNVISGSGTLRQAGPGTLILNGINTYTGQTTVDGGALRLGDALHPTASVGGNLTVNVAGTLQGYGTVQGDMLNNGGIVSPGASIGTITIGGNYNQSSTGTYVVQVDSAGNSDLLVVGGAATLGGTIGVSAINDGFLDFYPYTIITAAGGVAGQFSNVGFDNTFSQGFLKGKVLYFPSLVQLIISYDADQILAAVETPNQRAVADYLLNTGSTAAIQSLISSLTTDEQLRLALDQISGATYANQSLMLGRMGNWFSGELSDRFDAFPSCNDGPRDLFVGADTKTCDERNQWWFAGHASHDTVESSDVSGLNMDNSDGALGYEMSLNPQVKIGVGGAYNHFSGDATTREMGQISGDLYQVGLYGRYRTGNWWLGAAVDAGKTNDVNVSRQIDGVKGVVSTAGSYRANFYTEQARLSYDLTAQQAFRVSPFVGVINQQLDRNSFTETTETGFELSVDAASYHSTRSQLGAMLEFSKKTGIKPFVSVDWEHEFADNQTTFNASLVGVGGQFHIQSDRFDRNAALLKAGAVLFHGNRWDVAALYEGWFSGTCQQNGGTLQASLVLG